MCSDYIIKSGEKLQYLLLYLGNPMTWKTLDWKIQPNLTLLKQSNMTLQAVFWIIEWGGLDFQSNFRSIFGYKIILAKDLFNLGITDFQINSQKVSISDFQRQFLKSKILWIFLIFFIKFFMYSICARTNLIQKLLSVQTCLDTFWIPDLCFGNAHEVRLLCVNILTLKGKLKRTHIPRATVPWNLAPIETHQLALYHLHHQLVVNNEIIVTWNHISQRIKFINKVILQCVKP